MNKSESVKEEEVNTIIYNKDWKTSNTLRFLDAHVWECVI